MSLWEHAISTTEEVWAYLNPTQDDRDLYEVQMEGWVNGASQALERLLNRPIKLREFDVYQSGNGRRTLVTDYYPLVEVTTVEVSTNDRNQVYTISVDPDDRELAINYRDGKLTILPQSRSIGRWFHGAENVHLVYTAGFTGFELESFKRGVEEWCEILWREKGKSPRVQQENESLGNAYFSGRFDPRRLSFELQQLVYMYKATDL